MKPLFTRAQLRELATPFPDRIIRHIREQEIDQALAVCGEMQKSRILLHDYFAESCTVLWSFVGEQLGEDALDPMFRCIFQQSAQRQYYDVAGAQVMPHLTVLLLAKSWRAHSCFGAGDYPGRFRITEDAEKFTFHLEPCASGARLMKKGWYQPGNGGRTTRTPRPWTYNQREFPYYCVHCPYLNEILPYESGYGRIMWPVELPDGPEGGCAWHVYKNPDQVPDAYYNRIGRSRKHRTMRMARTRAARYFDPLELRDMARPMTNRIQESLRKGERNKAIRLCREVRDEFLPLHDLYIMMMVSTYTFIANQLGEEALGEALARQMDLCLKKQVLEDMDALNLKERVVFLAEKIFGADNCNGTGYIPGKFSILETPEEIRFVLSPCGSGGRLLRAGSYKAKPLATTLRETLENTMVTLAARHLPLPKSLLGLTFPWIVTHFTQRKPWGQGKTGQAFSWSFNQPETPYYCCQCGVIAERLKSAGLSIRPPARPKDPCVWALSKTENQV